MGLIHKSLFASIGLCFVVFASACKPADPIAGCAMVCSYAQTNGCAGEEFAAADCNVYCGQEQERFASACGSEWNDLYACIDLIADEPDLMCSESGAGVQIATCRNEQLALVRCALGTIGN